MARFLISTWPRSGMLAAAALVSALLAGCGAEWLNRRPADELAQRTRPPGSVYTGWRVYQDRCATCHGTDATGTANAPNLLLRLRDLGPRHFVGLVLQRYDWTRPPAATGSPAPTREAQIEIVMQRQDAPLTMPAWQGEPVVQAHVADLYAYLAARAEGTQGHGRPPYRAGRP